VYEIRFFTEHGTLAHVRTVECENDDAALERLAHERHPHALELWQAGRLVWRFEDRPI
jgi:hypothetical protein